MKKADATFEFIVSSMVDESNLTPSVVVQVVGIPPNGVRVLVATAEVPTAQARATARGLMEAAEHAEHLATTILALREQKVPEDVVEAVSARIRQRRERV